MEENLNLVADTTDDNFEYDEFEVFTAQYFSNLKPALPDVSKVLALLKKHHRFFIESFESSENDKGFPLWVKTRIPQHMEWLGKFSQEFSEFLDEAIDVRGLNNPRRCFIAGFYPLRDEENYSEKLLTEFLNEENNQNVVDFLKYYLPCLKEIIKLWNKDFPEPMDKKLREKINTTIALINKDSTLFFVLVANALPKYVKKLKNQQDKDFLTSHAENYKKLHADCGKRVDRFINNYLLAILNNPLQNKIASADELARVKSKFIQGMAKFCIKKDDSTLFNILKTYPHIADFFLKNKTKKKLEWIIDSWMEEYQDPITIEPNNVNNNSINSGEKRPAEFLTNSYSSIGEKLDLDYLPHEEQDLDVEEFFKDLPADNLSTLSDDYINQIPNWKRQKTEDSKEQEQETKSEETLFFDTTSPMPN